MISIKKNVLLWEIFIGGCLSVLVLTIYFSGDSDFEGLAMGTETVTSSAVDSSGRSIHLLHINGNELHEFMKGWEARGKKNVILFLGNSQTHSINQKKTNERIFVELIHAQLRFPDSEVLCASFPNASMQEFYLAYQFIKTKLPIIKVVIPVFYDDLREDGVRKVFFETLVDSKFQLAEDSGEFIAKKINSELRAYWSSNPNNKTSLSGNKDMLALKETFQEKTESYFNQVLDSSSRTWRNRSNARGEFFVWLYKLRNTVFGIKANTIRKMIPQRYDWNMASLKQMINDCVRDSVHVMLYVPPIRSDVPIPYDQLGYNSFKKSLSELPSQYPNWVSYKDYELIIPGRLWGFKGATNLTSGKELDYMHFQFEGHRILADSLLKALRHDI